MEIKRCWCDNWTSVMGKMFAERNYIQTKDLLEVFKTKKGFETKTEVISYFPPENALIILDKSNNERTMVRIGKENDVIFQDANLILSNKQTYYDV